MTLDRLLQDAGSHIDALIDEHLRGAGPSDWTSSPATRTDDQVVMLIERRPNPATRRGAVRWPAVAAAMVLLAVVLGVAIVQRQSEDDEPAGGSPTMLTHDRSIKDLHLDTMVFDGEWLWSTRAGATFLDRRDPTTGGVLESFNLSAATSTGAPVLHGRLLYVPTWNGVVEVDVRTGSISGSLAESGAGEVWSIAASDDAVWLCRRDADSQTLERWTPDLLTLETTVDLGTEYSFAVSVSGSSVYLATEGKGLQRYDANGRLAATIRDVGPAFEMVTAADGTLWVADMFSGDLIGVDPTTDAIRVRVPVAEQGLRSLEVTEDGVWVASYDDHLLAVVDPEAGTVTASTWLPRPPESVAFVADGAWVSGAGGWAMRFVPGQGSNAS